MKPQINASKALQFLLNNEYQRFKIAFIELNEKQPEEDQKPVPTFDVWLSSLGITEEKSSIIKPKGFFGK
jgi:hypothetical protein|tara:strand:- start:7116 stop:7325 length:210 start_codon:yes stop_codon:yes gene_type:complete